jgi:AhpD family alkylhydroperoxidase
MIAVAVSMANGYLYCLVAHGAALREALGDPTSSPTALRWITGG